MGHPTTCFGNRRARWLAAPAGPLARDLAEQLPDPLPGVAGTSGVVSANRLFFIDGATAAAAARTTLFFRKDRLVLVFIGWGFIVV